MEEKELLAYLAGIFDGEGSIMIKKDSRRIKIDMKNPQYSPRVSLKMNTEEIPKLLKDTFGGFYYKDKMIYQSKNGFHTNSPMYCYGAMYNIALNLVHRIYPYLIVKKKQADILFKLEEIKKNPEREKGNGEFHGTSYTKEYINKLENLWKEMKTLNHPNG